MSKFVLSLAVLAVFLTGCSLNMTKKLDAKTPEKFVLTEDAQDAVFRIADGWTGSMGSFPILETSEDGNGPMQFNDLPIFLDDNQAEEILKDKMPGCVVGRPLIKISANIILQKEKGVNHSIEPGPDGEPNEEYYYSAKVNKLNDLFIQAEECKD